LFQNLYFLNFLARARAKTIATDKPERENRKRKATKALEFSEEESDEEIASKILPKRKAAEKVEEKIKESRKRGRNNDGKTYLFISITYLLLSMRV